MRAAVSSIWPGKEIDKFEARKVYLHYVRINRLYRIWNYSEQKVISKKQARKVIKAHARVLKHHEDYLDIMLLLGYPEDFQKYLVDLMEGLDPIPDLFSKISGADTAKNIEVSDDV